MKRKSTSASNTAPPATSSHSLAGKKISDDEAIKSVIAAEAKVKKLQREVAALRKDRDDLLGEFTDLRNARPITPPTKPITKLEGDRVRVCVGDVHGQRMDRSAVEAFLADLKILDPDEIVLGGDIIDCGGWLAKHQPIGFVAYSDYSYQDDIEAANWFLDEIQKRAPKAKIHYVEGNHEDRVERWIVDQTMANQRDADFLYSLASPQTLLRLEEREIPYYRRSEIYGQGLPRGWVKLGNMYFTHTLGTGKNAARAAAEKTAGNVTYFCCFSPDTEIATPTGWKKYTEISEGDPVLTMNKESGQHEWQAIDKVVIRDDYAEYIHFQSKQADILVTPDHAMAVINRQTKEQLELEERLPVKRVAAHELVGKRFAIPLATVPKETMEDFPISDDLLRLIGWVVTEGYYEKQGSVRIAQSDRDDGSVSEIEALLQRLNITYGKFLSESKGTYRPHDGRTANYDHYSFYIPREWVDRNLRPLVPHKELQEWMLLLSPRQFKILFDVLIWADGSVNYTSKAECVQYATNKEKDRDIFQIMCAINGYRTSSIERERTPGAKPVFAISACSRGYGHISPFTGESVPVAGDKVWCVVVPNQTLVLRRAGKVFVCGNTHREDSATMVLPHVGLIKAFNPGCCCQMQPMWRNSDPTNWSQGYGIDIIARSGNFQRIHVPIWRGESLASAMVERFRS